MTKYKPAYGVIEAGGFIRSSLSLKALISYAEDRIGMGYPEKKEKSKKERAIKKEPQPYGHGTSREQECPFREITNFQKFQKHWKIGCRGGPHAHIVKEIDESHRLTWRPHPSEKNWSFRKRQLGNEPERRKRNEKARRPLHINRSKFKVELKAIYQPLSKTDPVVFEN